MKYISRRDGKETPDGADPTPPLSSAGPQGHLKGPLPECSRRSRCQKVSRTRRTAAAECFKSNPYYLKKSIAATSWSTHRSTRTSAPLASVGLIFTFLLDCTTGPTFSSSVCPTFGWIFVQSVCLLLHHLFLPDQNALQGVRG